MLSSDELAEALGRIGELEAALKGALLGRADVQTALAVSESEVARLRAALRTSEAEVEGAEAKMERFYAVARTHYETCHD